MYEHIVYDNNEHVRIGSFPKMWDRTVSVYSGGKVKLLKIVNNFIDIFSHRMESWMGSWSSPFN